MWARKLRPPSRQLTSVRVAARGVRTAPKTKRTIPARAPPPQDYSPSPEKSPEKETSSTRALSDALRHANPEDNNLLSPVHIPEDPNGVLNERHPATKILSNSAIVVTRQLEFYNLIVGLEQANRYVIMDPHGNHIGYMAEHDGGFGKLVARQSFRTHRSFTTHVFDKHENEVLRFHRPFSWLTSRIRVYDPLVPASNSPGAYEAYSMELEDRKPRLSTIPLSEMGVIGEAQQTWAPLRRKYDLFTYYQSPNIQSNTKKLSGDTGLSESQQLQISKTANSDGEYNQFAYVNEPFLSWDFSLLTNDSRILGSVNRNFAGIGRELFTDTGVYALRMDAAGLAQEPRHLISQSGHKAESAYDNTSIGMTLDQRAVMLATAVSIDFDYFSIHSTRGSGLFGFFPFWIPVGGEGVAEAGAAGAASEVGEAGATAAGGVAKGVAGMGEGAAVGAGTMAGYEAMQRGMHDGWSGQPPSNNAPPPPPPPQGQPPGEDVWGEGSDPWSGGSGGGGSSSGGAGGGGGGDGGWTDWF